jgi:hypothetical protein
MTYEEAIKYYSNPSKKTTPVKKTVPVKKTAPSGSSATNYSGLPSQQYAKSLTNEQLDQVAATSGYNPTIVTKKPKAPTNEQLDQIANTSGYNPVITTNAPKATTPKYTAPVVPKVTAPVTPSTGQLGSQITQQKQQEADVIYPVNPGANNPAYGQTIQYPSQQTPYNQYTDPQWLANQTMQQYAELQASSIAQLKQAYEQAMAELTGQRPGIEQSAQSNLNANDSYYIAQALPQMRAAMEAAGTYGGGEMLGQNVGLLAMRGQNANDINLQKTNQLQAIADAVAQLNVQQPLKEAEIQSSLSADAIQAAMTNANTGIQNQLSQAQLTGNLGGVDTLEKIRDAYNQAMGITDRTGYLSNGTQTLQGQQAQLSNEAQQLQNELSRLDLQNYPEEQRLKIEQLKSEIANIGKVASRTPEEIELDKVKLQQAKAELDEFNKQRSTPTVGNWQNYYKTGMDMKNSYQSSDAIRQWIYNLVINGELSEADGETLEQSLGVTPGFGNTIKDTFNSLF